MADDIPGLPYDGVTDVVDLSGNGKGVALNVWPSDNRVPVAEDPIPLDTFVLEMGELAYASTSQRLRVGDGYTAGGDEVAYLTDIDVVQDALDQWVAAMALALNGKANLIGGNSFEGNQLVTGNVIVTDDAYGPHWDNNTIVPTKNAVYDKIEAVAASIPPVPSDAIYDASWNGVANIAPSKNAVYDKIESVIAAIPPVTSSIVGITGTLAQFNTALTDDNFAAIGRDNNFTASQSINAASAQLSINPSSGSSLVELFGAAGTQGFRVQGTAGIGYLRADTVYITNKTGAVNYGVFGPTGLAVTGNVSVTDEVYGASWNGSLNVPTKNAVYDKFEALGSITVLDDPYGAGWNGSLAAPSRNAVYDKIEAMSVGGTGVTTFNTRSGAVVLTSGDVTTALTFTPANKAGDTFTGAVLVPDLVYGLAWSGSFAVPTRNAVYNQIEALTTVVAGKATTAQLANYLPLTGGTVTGTLAISGAVSGLVMNDRDGAGAWIVYSDNGQLLYHNGTTVLANLDAGGSFNAQSLSVSGPAGALNLNDRDGAGTIIVYNNADMFRVFVAGADRFAVGETSASFANSLSVGGTLTTSGVLTVNAAAAIGSGMTVAGNLHLTHASAPTFLLGAGPLGRISATAAKQIIYRADSHHWEKETGGATLADIDGNGNLTVVGNITAPAGTVESVIMLARGSTGTFAGANIGACIESRALTGATDGAWLAFHRPGAAGMHIGLDADGWFKIGGWSWGYTPALQLSQNGDLKLAGGIIELPIAGQCEIRCGPSVGHGIIYMSNANAGFFKTGGSHMYQEMNANGKLNCSGRIVAAGAHVFRHQSGSYASSDITFSTAAPSGGADGDIWLKYV